MPPFRKEIAFQHHGISILLRPPRLSDAASLARNINDRRVYRYTLHIPYPYRLIDAKRWVARVQRRHRQRPLPSYQLVIVVNDEVIGGFGFTHLEVGYRSEIGYWLAPKWWGNGIMTQVVRTMVKHGFSVFRLRRIYAYTFVQNTGSQRVLEHNRFRREGLLVENVKKDGRPQNEYLYARTKYS